MPLKGSTYWCGTPKIQMTKENSKQNQDQDISLSHAWLRISPILMRSHISGCFCYVLLQCQETWLFKDIQQPRIISHPWNLSAAVHAAAPSPVFPARDQAKGTVPLRTLLTYRGRERAEPSLLVVAVAPPLPDYISLAQKGHMAKPACHGAGISISQGQPLEWG